MNLLLSAFGEWFAKNWIILVLIVLAIALLVPSYLRQKKEMNARNELNSSIKKGTKIITTAGVYGTVQSIEETTDGKVVTIVTGSAKNPTTMTIHINAIGGIDNKKPVTADETSDDKEVKAAQGRAIKRAIYTAIIYFVVVLVTVVMNLISAGETGNTGGWEACWNQAK